MNPFSEQSDLTDVEKEFLRLSTLSVKGDAKAQTSLAHKYALGKGVEKDMNEAVRWYRVAGNQGEAEAQFNLGILLDRYLQRPQLALAAYERYLTLTDAEELRVQAWIADLRERLQAAEAPAADPAAAVTVEQTP